MLKNISPLISPELLKILDEMGHNDRLIIGDVNFAGASLTNNGKGKLVRADGLGAAEMLEAILQLIPLDIYVEKPAVLIEKEAIDSQLKTPIWDTFAEIIARYDKRGASAIAKIPRHEFYKAASDVYAIVQTSERALYGCIMLQKGVI